MVVVDMVDVDDREATDCGSNGLIPSRVEDGKSTPLSGWQEERLLMNLEKIKKGFGTTHLSTSLF